MSIAICSGLVLVSRVWPRFMALSVRSAALWQLLYRGKKKKNQINSIMGSCIITKHMLKM